MKLSIIIVTYNNEELIDPLTRGLLYDPNISSQKTDDSDFEMIFIDNNSIDTTRNILERKKEIFGDQIVLIFNKENLGFAKAVNQGIKKSGGDYILLLNSDAFINREQVGQLLDIINSDSKIGIAAPRLLNVDGSIQPSFGNFPNIFTAALYLSRLDKILPWGMVVYPRVPSSKFQVSRLDWVSGACLLIKKEVFREVGVFDEHYFFGIEDIDFCYRVRLAGYVIMYCPEISITHYHQYSSKKSRKRLFVVHSENSSLKYFYKKFYPWAWARYYIFSFLIWIKDALQSLKVYYENYSTNK